MRKLEARVEKKKNKVYKSKEGKKGMFIVMLANEKKKNSDRKKRKKESNIWRDDDLTQEEKRWKLREIAWEEKTGRRVWSKIDRINIDEEQWWQNKKQRLLRDRYGNGKGVKKQSEKEEKRSDRAEEGGREKNKGKRGKEKKTKKGERKK